VNFGRISVSRSSYSALLFTLAVIARVHCLKPGACYVIRGNSQGPGAVSAGADDQKQG